ncbi:MAG: hypothetical protein MJA84_07910 [Firmicutes bacterium]|nr:hypothetical protein [Bacillota bacterium]
MFIDKLKKIFNKTETRCVEKKQETAVIKIDDVTIAMARDADLQVPHEFSIVVPRVEIKQRYYFVNRVFYEKEAVYSSITIVHAPQYPSQEPRPVPVPEDNNPSSPPPKTKHKKAT